jgi:hypothetical protein
MFAPSYRFHIGTETVLRLLYIIWYKILRIHTFLFNRQRIVNLYTTFYGYTHDAIIVDTYDNVNFDFSLTNNRNVENARVNRILLQEADGLLSAKKRDVV